MSELDPLARDWLVRLRWGAVAGQVATVGFAWLAFDRPLPFLPLAGVVGLTALSNVALARARRARAIPAAVFFDIGALTTLLALSGGASNPFSALFLVHVALAAALLGPAWTWRAALAAMIGFGLLFPFTDPHAMHQGAGLLNAHLLGMWVAFGVAAAAIASFVARVVSAMRAREQEVAALRRAAEEQEKVVALATLAAGAAHELGQPLAVIAVASREVEELGEGPVVEEARAIRRAVDRARGIVTRLTQRAGAGLAEPAEPLRFGELAAELRAELTPADAARLRVEGEALALRAPRTGLREALSGLVRNALLAGEGEVWLRARDDGAGALLEVEDTGVGMEEAVLRRAGEPFFTTRPEGRGMGLGLFLVRRFAASLGGRLDLRSAPGQGTKATLWLPP